MEERKINLKKCTLDPVCRKDLKKTLRNEKRCEDCGKCGWNKDVIIRRMAQEELKK